MMKFLFVSISLFLIGVVFADELSTAGYKEVGNKEDPLRLVTDGNLFAMNPKVDGALYSDFEAGSILVFDAKNNELVDVVALAEYARKMGFGGKGSVGKNDLSKLKDAQKVMDSQIEKILKDVPAGQREMVRKQLEKRMKIDVPAASAASDEELTAVATGNSKKIGEYDAAEVDILRDKKVIRRLWTVPASKLKGGPQLLKAIKQFNKLYDASVKGIPGAGDRSFFSDIDLIGDSLPVAANVIDENLEWIYTGPAQATDGDLKAPDLPIRRTP